MRLIMVAAAGIALTSAAQASTKHIVVETAPRTSVSYAGLDLHSAAGRAAFAGRIRSASERLCLENNVAPLAEKLDRVQCYRAAVASGTVRMTELAR